MRKSFKSISSKVDIDFGCSVKLSFCWPISSGVSMTKYLTAGIRIKITNKPNTMYTFRQPILSIKGSTKIGRITPEKDMPMAAIPKATPALLSNQLATNFVTDRLPKAGPPTASKVP